MLPLIFRTKSPQVKVTKVVQLTTDKEESIEGIQYIIEAYYESLEAIDRTVHSDKGQDVMQKSNAMPGELSIFIANEKFVPAKKSWNKPMKKDF